MFASGFEPFDHYCCDMLGTIYDENFNEVKPFLSNGKYPCVKLYTKEDRIPRLIYVHRFVFMSWVGPVVEIDHIDRNPLNNNLFNLRSVSRSQNLRNRNPYRWSDEAKRNREMKIIEKIFSA